MHGPERPFDLKRGPVLGRVDVDVAGDVPASEHQPPVYSQGDGRRIQRDGDGVVGAVAVRGQLPLADLILAPV